MAISNNIFKIITISQGTKNCSYCGYKCGTCIAELQISEYQTLHRHDWQISFHGAHLSASFNIVMRNGAIEGATASKQRFVTLLHSLLVRVCPVEAGIF